VSNTADKRSVMLVEDDEGILATERKELENHGFRVISYSDPQSAMRYLKRGGNSISLVIINARMVEMTGFKLAREIKLLRPTLKVILISTFEIKQGELEKVMPHTLIDGFLCKPFPISRLVEVIDQIV
jgi:two-component system cell cycle sensor histidine kinase/response regulator CckA